MVHLPVLVLNQNYEPLNVCQVRRAVILLFRNKAEVVENGRGMLHSVDGDYVVPSVIRLFYFIKKPQRKKKMTKLEVFNRDKFICQYCGWQGKELTIDHVIPRTRGGEHTWENVVTACVLCNRKKAGYTPDEAEMPLLNQPKSPRGNGFYVPYHYLKTNVEWKSYLKQ